MADLPDRMPSLFTDLRVPHGRRHHHGTPAPRRVGDDAPAAAGWDIKVSKELILSLAIPVDLGKGDRFA
jgi:hypothetical protein